MMTSKSCDKPLYKMMWYTGQQPVISILSFSDRIDKLTQYNKRMCPETLPSGSVWVFCQYTDNMLQSIVLFIYFVDNIGRVYGKPVYTNSLLNNIDIDWELEQLNYWASADENEDEREPYVSDIYNYYFIGNASNMYLNGNKYLEYMGLIRYGWDITYESIKHNYSEEANDFAKRVQEDRDRVNAEFAGGDDDFQFLSSLKLSATKQGVPNGLLWYTGQRTYFDWRRPLSAPSYDDLLNYNIDVWPDDLPDGSMFITCFDSNTLCVGLVRKNKQNMSVWLSYTFSRHDIYRDEHGHAHIKPQKLNTIMELTQLPVSHDIGQTSEYSFKGWMSATGLFDYSSLKLSWSRTEEYLGLIRYGWDTSYEEVQKHYSEGLGETTKMVMQDRERVNKLIEEGGDDDFQILSSVDTTHSNEIPETLLWYTRQKSEVDPNWTQVQKEYFIRHNTSLRDKIPESLPDGSIIVISKIHLSSGGNRLFDLWLTNRDLVYKHHIKLLHGMDAIPQYSIDRLKLEFRPYIDAKAPETLYNFGATYELPSSLKQAIPWDAEYMGILRYGWDTYYDDIIHHSLEVSDFAKRVREDRDRAIQELSEGDDDFQILSSLKLSAKKETPPGNLLWFTGQSPRVPTSYYTRDTHSREMCRATFEEYKVIFDNLPDGSVLVAHDYFVENPLVSSNTKYIIFVRYNNEYWFKIVRVPSGENMSINQVYDFIKDNDIYEYKFHVAWGGWYYGGSSKYSTLVVGNRYEHMGIARYGWDTYYKGYLEEANEMARMVQEDRDRAIQELSEGDGDFQLL